MNVFYFINQATEQKVNRDLLENFEIIQLNKIDKLAILPSSKMARVK